MPNAFPCPFRPVPAWASRLLAGLLLVQCLTAQTTTTPDVGSGAPDEVIRSQFVNAYFRSGFSNLVSLPPVANVRRFGTTGLIQEFPDAAKTSGVRLALVKPTSVGVEVEGQVSVYQVTALVYSLYNTVGVTTAGYPTMDTATCLNSTPGTCFFQLFSNKYALFAYSVSLPNGQTFSVRDPFFTLWSNAGGIAGLGPATSAETAGTSSKASAYTSQSFATGIAFNITGGLANGKQLVVASPVYEAYLANGGRPAFSGYLSTLPPPSATAASACSLKAARSTTPPAAEPPCVGP